MNSDNRHLTNPNFTTAAFVCGILAITLSCLYLSLPLGALGLVFVTLNLRHRTPIDRPTRYALCFNVSACIYGAYGLFRLYQQVQLLLSDPAYLEKLNKMYQTMYDANMQSILRNSPALK